MKEEDLFQNRIVMNFENSLLTDIEKPSKYHSFIAPQIYYFFSRNNKKMNSFRDRIFVEIFGCTSFE